MMKVAHAFQDLLIRILPRVGRGDSYEFAFIVHPRSRHDVARKYSFFKHIPDKFADMITKYFWPVTLSKITGLKSKIDGKVINGHLISVLITAHQMVENRPLALRRITQACVLAQKRGAKIVGLGGLTSSFSRGGLDLIDKVDINVTTGHAYTSYNVTQNILALTNYMNLDREIIWVGIVGAAGSIGSTTAELLARGGFNRLILIDLERKHDHFPQLIEKLRSLNPRIIVNQSHQIRDLIRCDIIVAATNAPEALIKSEDLKSGAIVIDDAQPSDVHPSVFERNDVLVIEAGVTHTPNINSNFNFGLKDKQDNFCCLAEVFILAANEWDQHYVINRATPELVDKIAELGKKLNFRIANYQNFFEPISNTKLEYMRRIINSNVIQN